MAEWITANLGTIIAGLILLSVICLAAGSVIRDRRKGRSACGSNCAHCAMAASCHRKTV